MPFTITTMNIMALSITTLNIMALSITTLNKIVTLSRTFTYYTM
jgi:hypothetical protein